MNRRYFLLGSLAAMARYAGRAATRRKILIALFDGFGPEYLESSDMPVLKRIAGAGGLKIGASMIPSVTNVNNASVVTGTFPDEHGITTNFYYDPATGRAEEMKSDRFLLSPTIFEKAAALGWKTAIVSSKDKVRTLCSRGAAISASAEVPEARFLEKAGPKQNMYSAAVNYWSLRLARYLLRHESIDLLYLSTSDYMMHTYAPAEELSLEHLHTVDRMLGEILEDHSGIELYLTADHGMNAKTDAVDPVRLLNEAGIQAAASPIIKDTHKVHHQDLGGCYYLYLKSGADVARAIKTLRAVPEVEDCFDRDTGARQFHLRKERIGDIFLLARRDAVFGELSKLRQKVKVRTHGSRHESAVPLIAHGRKIAWSTYHYNFDLTRHLTLERV